jgi:pectinesterase
LAEPGKRYDHLTALRGRDYLLVYTWNGRNIALNPDLMQGNQYSVNWYSPKNGIFMNAGEIRKGEKFEFNPPGEKGDGNDWVLILIKYTASSSMLTIPRDSSFTPYLAWLKLARDFPQAKIVEDKLPAGLNVNFGVTYKTLPVSPYGKRELHLDIFHPKKAGQYPVLLLIHGGGWRSGNKTMENQMAQQIATHGYFTATVEYRLSPEAIYPAAVQDIKAAIRFLRSNSKKFGIDPNRFAISGTSAGGQLAALVGMTGEEKKFDGEETNPKVSAKIQAIIDIDGVLDFSDPNESAKDDDPLKPSAGAYWFGATLKQAPEKWTEASPIIHAGKNSPPILFINSVLPRFHAGRDSVINILNQYGIYSEVHTIEMTPHPFWLFHPWFEPTIGYMMAFLDRIFKK